MLIGGKSGKKWCIGFPEGYCSVREDGSLEKASKKKKAGNFLTPEEKYYNGFTPTKNGDICFSCNLKRGMSKRNSKKMKLLHRQDEHELSMLKILMSELTVKKPRQSKSSKMDGKGRLIRGSLEDHHTEQDQLFLDDLFKFIQHGNVNDLDQVADYVGSVFRKVESKGPLDERVWWTQTHILDKSKAGWKEGFTETGFDKDGKGTGKYVKDADGNFVEVSSVLGKSLVKIGTSTYNIKTGVIPNTNTGQIQKFLARLEGVRCEGCNKNKWNLSENICKDTECPGRVIDEYGEIVPSTNIKNQGVNVVRKRARLGQKRKEFEKQTPLSEGDWRPKLDVSSRTIVEITDHHPNAEEAIQIKKEDEEYYKATGKKRKDIQNIIWRITEKGANWVAINETLNRFNQERRKGLDE